jgi:5-oxoprolinase (ATP-hydrolysing) subunit A
MAPLNCDVGESGSWRLGDDCQIMPKIHMANVACRFPVSDFNHMRETVRLAEGYVVEAGALPSPPDRQGSGRRSLRD